MGRFRAAHFFGLVLGLGLGGLVMLGGCSFSSSPFWATIGSFVPGQHGDIAARAKKIPYASIDLSLGRRGGLLVLAEQQSGLTYWQTGRAEVVVLNHGFLQSTSGLTPQLEMNQAIDAQGRPVSMTALGSAAHFVVERSWIDEEGVRHTGRARADWSCDSAARSVELPLTTRDLYKCVETLDWAGGGDTRSVYWRDDGGHVWKADVAAWPGAPEISWQVARPWWPLR
ncbi:YjbF family lipoprotein [Salinisphaera sp.]|uniref:YjbF family lipoprotein n=1 Tax=Salinisphaera sp. TaxID=1914330 RepID=UPI002D7A386C|nr:YjbF family lipoprotein [Salinisphaera sp.]HET7315083.1 YjbF family lipoprotein [Salinisphaera sp.]